MVTGFAALLVVHGLIHLLGFAKAFGLAELPQLRLPISSTLGVLWLLAALLFLGTAVALFAWPRVWWVAGAVALFVSLAVIVPSWADAKLGLVANAIVAVGLVFGFLSQGPLGLQAEYERDVRRSLEGPVTTEPVTEADLARLPAPVRRYLRLAGVVGQPRVHDVRVRMHGRIRQGPHARWMPFRAEQHNVLDPPARLFYLNASMFAIPVQGYHRYAESAATMRVKAAALIPIVSASGPEMTQAETVTMLNDMCIMAPATLIDAAIQWEEVGDLTATAIFTNAGHTIRARLFFNARGELTNFVSNDRYQDTGKGATPVPWSTPVGAYRSFGSVRLPSGGEGRWRDAHGDYAYIQLTIDEVEYNVRPGRGGSASRPAMEESHAGR
jgi:hypothetical protein